MRIFLILLFINFANAQDDFDFGAVEQSAPPVKKSLTTTLSLNLGYQYAKPERFQEISPSAFFRYDKSFPWLSIYGEGDIVYNAAYEIEEDSNFVKENYSFVPQIRELYAKKAFKTSSLSVGKQMHYWSKMDFLPASDFMSRSDLTKSYFAKVEDSRLGQWGLRWDYFYNRTRINIVSLAPEPDLIADGDHPYSLSSGLDLKSKIQNANPDYSLRWAQEGSKTGFAVSMGETYNKTPIVNYSQTDKEVYLQHNFYALNFDHVLEPILIKAELVYTPNKIFQTINDSGIPNGYITQEEHSIALGADWNPQYWGSFVFETSYSHSKEHESSNISGDGSLLMFAISWSETFIRDTYELSLTSMFIEDLRNSLIRIDQKYDLNDTCNIKNQISWFEAASDDSTIKFIKNLDRVDVSLNCSF